MVKYSALPDLRYVQKAVYAVHVDKQTVVGNGRHGSLPELRGIGTHEVGEILRLGSSTILPLFTVYADGQKRQVDASKVDIHLFIDDTAPLMLIPTMYCTGTRENTQHQVVESNLDKTNNNTRDIHSFAVVHGLTTVPPIKLTLNKNGNHIRTENR